MARIFQAGQRVGPIGFLDQQIIGIEGGYGEHADSLLSEWRNQRRQHTDSREVDGPCDSQAPPALFAPHIKGQNVFGTNDRKLVLRAGNREESCLPRPGRNRIVGRKPANGESA